MENKWRFPINGFGPTMGLGDGGVETFQKDSMSSLAREVCQNSIDASTHEGPVRVEFSSFSIPRKNIPGIDDLTDYIDTCYKYKGDTAKEGPELTSLKANIEKQNITCLRISDFNTTGLTGSENYSINCSFHYLTKGSGESNKPAGSAGSKGIGKFASFVISQTNTVFYSTYANDGGRGYMGMTKLRSVPLSEDDEENQTYGIGYFGSNERNHPIGGEELKLDPSFARGENFGTDIYLIGFDAYQGWEYRIIAEIVNSFMLTILNNGLELLVNGIKVDKATIGSIIYSDAFCKKLGKKILRDIHSQYEIMTSDDNVYCEDIDIEGNKLTVYVKKYSQTDEAKATRHCLMVRHPYMKIKHITASALLPYSALCVIHEGHLNDLLRDVENAQHTDWELDRISKFPERYKETYALKKKMENAVAEFIMNVLSEGAGEETDMEGAGEFLPAPEEGLGEARGKGANGEEIVVNPIVPVKVQNPKTARAGEDGEGFDFDTGERAEEGEEGRPMKKKKKLPPNPNPNPHPEPGDTPDKYGPGDEPYLKKVPLSGMRYRTVQTDARAGRYTCAFTSLYDELDCELQLRMCGEGREKFPVNIISACVGDEPCDIVDGKIVGLTIVKGETYNINCVVDTKEQFASEVIMSANR